MRPARGKPLDPQTNSLLFKCTRALVRLHKVNICSFDLLLVQEEEMFVDVYVPHQFLVHKPVVQLSVLCIIPTCDEANRELLYMTV